MAPAIEYSPAGVTAAAYFLSLNRDCVSWWRAGLEDMHVIVCLDVDHM